MHLIKTTWHIFSIFGCMYCSPPFWFINCIKVMTIFNISNVFVDVSSLKLLGDLAFLFKWMYCYEVKMCITPSFWWNKFYRRYGRRQLNIPSAGDIWLCSNILQVKLSSDFIFFTPVMGPTVHTFIQDCLTTSQVWSFFNSILAFSPWNQMLSPWQIHTSQQIKSKNVKNVAKIYFKQYD